MLNRAGETVDLPRFRRRPNEHIKARHSGQIKITGRTPFALISEVNVIELKSYMPPLFIIGNPRSFGIREVDYGTTTGLEYCLLAYCHAIAHVTSCVTIDSFSYSWYCRKRCLTETGSSFMAFDVAAVATATDDS